MPLFPSGFPIKTLYAFLLSTIRATYPARFILLHFDALTLLDGQFKVRSFSLGRYKIKIRTLGATSNRRYLTVSLNSVITAYH
jgi:hypothetical protein